MYPENITVGSRFFFFNELKEDKDPFAPKIVESVNNILNNGNLNKNDVEGEQQILDALNFLKDMYEKEAEIEHDYFESEIINNPIIQNNPKYLNLAQNCFKNESIDYISFMNLLKIIENEKSGSDWNKTIGELYTEVNSFNDTVNEYLEKKNKKLEDFPTPQFIIGRLFQELNYAEKRQQSTLNQAIGKTRSIVSATLGSTDSRNIFVKLLPEVKEKILPRLFKNNNNNEIKLTTPQNLAYTTNLLQYIYELIKSEQKNNDDNSDNILDILDSLLDTNNVDDNDKSFMSKINQRSNSLLQDVDLLEEQGKQIMPKANEKVTINSKGKIIGLTSDIRQKLELITSILIEGTDNLSTNNNNKGRMDAKTFEKYKKELKKKIRIIMNKKRLSDKDMVEYINFLLNTNSVFTMYDQTEHNAAQALSNIFQNGKAKVIGGSLGKSDVTVLDLGRILIKGEVKDLDKLTKTLLDKYEKDYSEYYENERKKISETIYDNQLFSYKNSYSVLAQTEAVAKSQLELAKAIGKAKGIKDDEEAKKVGIEQLKNTFIIDASVKHSDFVFDKIGFSGGSIGANIIEQIENICDFFELGGITTADRDWLIFATLNCGSGLLGSNLRPTLENYFSVVASMLMFRTGGLLADQIREENEQYHWYNSAKNIHIFPLNGIFVPASYILRETYKALSAAYYNIEAEAHASKAQIRNNVNIRNIVKIKDEKTNKFVGDWNATYEKNFKRVSINVQILAGFLDILDQLNQQLNSFN